jgi:hypothetical protein
MTGKSLLFGVPDGALDRVFWEGSIAGAASRAVGPMISSPALAPAVVWAGLAALLPLLVRGRFLGLDVIAAAAWAAALVVAQAALGDLLASVTVLDQPRGGAAGPIAAALLVLAAAAAAPTSTWGTGEPVTAGRGIP